MGAALGPAQCACDLPRWACWGEGLQALSARLPGSCEIWKPGVTAYSPSDLQGGYFSKQFDLEGIPVSGSIRVAVDDLAEVRVNGSMVGSTGSVTDLWDAGVAQSNLVPFDLTPYLVTGTNTITIRAQNGPAWYTAGTCDPCNYTNNPAGLVFGGSLSFIAPVPTRPRSWGTLKAVYR